MSRLSGLGLRPSGFDPTRRVQRSGLKKHTQLISKGSCIYHGRETVSSNWLCRVCRILINIVSNLYRLLTLKPESGIARFRYRA